MIIKGMYRSPFIFISFAEINYSTFQGKHPSTWLVFHLGSHYDPEWFMFHKQRRTLLPSRSRKFPRRMAHIFSLFVRNLNRLIVTSSLSINYISVFSISNSGSDSLLHRPPRCVTQSIPHRPYILWVLPL